MAQSKITKKHDNHEAKPLGEAKLLLVGEGGVGKTSLAKRLIENSFDPTEATTEGINIERWQINLNDLQLTLNVWDFGGQEIMHSTHQLFFTSRSIYILVIDARRGSEESQIEYWLKLIASFGSNSPIILVANKSDQYSPDIDWTGLKIKYPTISAIARRVSCKTGEGLQELRSIIVDSASRLKHIHDLVPLSWFNLKNQLADIQVDYIQYAQYREFCRENGIDDEKSQRVLLQFLHDLGLVLHFEDNKLLKDTILLNPKWITGAIYKILNSNELFQNKGLLEAFSWYVGTQEISFLENELKFLTLLEMMDKLPPTT